MNMFMNVIILCIFNSMCDAIFHHHQHHSSPPSHSRIHVCLTPPNTMLKVQKHINECKHEVKANIFNEAFSLIHEHSFKHPHELHNNLHTIDLHDDVHGPDVHNLTLSEQELLKFFEDHDHFGGHLGPIDDPLPSAIPSLAHLPIESTFLPPWQRPFPNHLYKKTDLIQSNGKSSSNDMQRSASAQNPSVQNPYQYFNIDTGEATKRIDRQRRDLHLLKHLHKDHHHHHSDDDSSHHEESIHPTAIDFKDKRIAGCLMHCLYDKDNAIDHHTGYPTLDGLVNFYSDGVHEHGFFMTTLRAVDYCLKGASHKYHINRHIKPNAAIKCDLAFDVFDCVSDRITEYCSKHHFHDSHFDLKEHFLEHFDKYKDHHYHYRK